MSFGLAVLLSIIIGLMFGGVWKWHVRKFSWPAFFIAFFTFLGLLKFTFGLNIASPTIQLAINILFWPAAFIALISLALNM